MNQLELEFNDYVSNIFVFTIRDGFKQYYFSCKDDWLIDGWQYMVNDVESDYESEMLNKLAGDTVSIELVNEEYKRLYRNGKEFVIETHLPMLFIDFDNKILKSRYYEQELHNRVPNNWIGKYEDFLNEIPIEFKYWTNPKEST